MSKRYALYFAPAADSPLARFGEIVLGRTATQPRTGGAASAYPDTERWLALTESPAHYGFHATLKAPFELAEGRSIDELRTQAEEFARGQLAVPLIGLQPRHLANFAALTLERQSSELSRFAQGLVEAFEPYRRPLSDSDMQRRKSQPLSTRQLELLERFGYPYVDEEFRFHMTLTGTIVDQDQDYLEWLQDIYQQHVTDAPQLDQLAIYTQDSRTAPFIRLCSYPLNTA